MCVCVCVCVCQHFLQRAGLEDDLSDFCLKSGLDLLLLMTVSFTESQEPIRELAVYSPNAACREEVPPPPPALPSERCCHDNCPLSQASQYLEEAQNQTLGLCPISSPLPHLRAYHQGNHLHSSSSCEFPLVSIATAVLALLDRKPLQQA